MAQKKIEIYNVVKGGGINLLFEALNKILAFIFVILITRLFPPSAVGDFFWGFSLISVVTTITLLGLDKGIVKMNSRFYKEHLWGRSRHLMKKSLLLGSVTALAGTFLLFVSPLSSRPLMLAFLPLILLSVIKRIFQSFIWSSNNMVHLNSVLVFETLLRLR